MSYIIGRPIGGISLNGLEYLLDEDQNVLTFESVKSAEAHLIDIGFSQSVIDNGIIIKKESEYEQSYCSV